MKTKVLKLVAAYLFISYCLNACSKEQELFVDCVYGLDCPYENEDSIKKENSIEDTTSTDFDQSKEDGQWIYEMV